MPFDGSGNFTRLHNWQADAAASIPIKADRHDQEDDNFKGGLSNVITKDGQTQPTANIPMNGHKITGLGTGTVGTDAVNLSQLNGLKTFSEAISLTGVDAKGRITFAGSQSPAPDANSRPLGISWTQTDLFFGTRAQGSLNNSNSPDTDKFVWVQSSLMANGANDLMDLTAAGVLSHYGGTVNLISEATGAGTGPVLNLKRNKTGAGADADVLAQVLWQGKNSASALINYVDMFVQVSDATAGSEDATLYFRRMVDGALLGGLYINAGGVTVQQNLTVTGTTTFTGVPTFEAMPVFKGNLKLESVDGSASAGPLVYFDRLSPSPADSDILTEIFFRGKNSGAATTVYADIYALINDVSAGTEDGSLVFRTIANGAMTGALTLNPTTATIHTPLTVLGNLSATGAITATASIASTTGHVTAEIYLYTNGGGVIGSSAQLILGLASAGSGNIYLRPKGYNVNTNQTSIDANGNMTVNGTANIIGSVTSSQQFLGSATTVLLAPTTAGTIYFRPQGPANAANQTTISSAGDMNVQGGVAAAGDINAGTFLVKGAVFASSSTHAFLTAVGGNIYFRPNGGAAGSGTVAQGYYTGTGDLYAAGDLTCGANVSAATGRFISGTTLAILAATGAGSIYLRPNGNGSVTGQLLVEANGNLTISSAVATKTTGTTWANPSDGRLKNLRGLYQRGLDAILQLQPMLFDYKDSPELGECIGLVAEDVEPVMPETISRFVGTVEGKVVKDLRKFDGSPLFFAFINAFKELAARLTALEEEGLPA